MFEIKKYTEHITLCIFCYFYNPPNIRNPLIYCVNRYCLRSASVGAKRTSTGCSAPHVWRVPSSKALSCKHERLFDLLTLASSYYITVSHSHTSPRFGIISPLSESSGRKAASARSAAHRPSVHSCCRPAARHGCARLRWSPCGPDGVKL